MKQTEIGLIPDDWEVKSLGEISMDFSYGVGAEAIPYNGNDKYIRITDIDDITNEFSPNPLCSPKFYSSNYIVQEDDILFARTGASVGKTYIYNKKDGRLIFAGFLMKIHVNDANSKFIFYQTLTNNYKLWVISESMRTGQPGLNLEQIKNYTILVPPIAEQQRIAKALSDVDALISTTEKLIQKKKNIKQGTMQNLLTGKKRLPGFGPQTKSPTYKQTELGPIPEDWEVKRLEEIEIKNGEMLKSDEYKEGTIPVIAGGKKPAGYHNRYNRKGNTITISGSGANAGFVSFYEQPIFASDCSTINEQKNIQIEYLFYSLILKQEEIYNCQAGGAQPHIHAKDIKDLFVLIPKNDKEQIAIANVLSSMDKEIETLNTKLEKYRNLKIAMMQQLLTGKIRLV